MPWPRLEFAVPRRRRLVYLGATGNSLLRTYIAESDFVVYRNVRDLCNVWIALIAILLGRWSARGYYRTFLMVVRPSFVVTFEDNSLEFYLTKSYRPDCKTFCIQNGRRDSYSRDATKTIWSLIREVCHQGVAPDVVATHGTPWSEYFTSSLGVCSTNVVEIGSVRNNALSIGAKRSEPRVLFISSFPNLGPEGRLQNFSPSILGYWQGEPVEFGAFYSIEGLIAQSTAAIAQARDIEFLVLGKRPSWQKGEFSYFSDALADYPWRYLPSETEASSYAAVSESDVIVNIDSTFGYEMFARGVRVAFVSARMQHAGLPHVRDCEFGFPFVTETTGPFWTNQSTGNEVERVINYVIDADEPKWKSVAHSYRESIMPFDFGNTRVCALLSSLGISTSGPGVWNNKEIPNN